MKQTEIAPEDFSHSPIFNLTSRALTGLCSQSALENASGAHYLCVKMFMHIIWKPPYMELIFRQSRAAGSYLKEWWTCTDFHLTIYVPSQSVSQAMPVKGGQGLFPVYFLFPPLKNTLGFRSH